MSRISRLMGRCSDAFIALHSGRSKAAVSLNFFIDEAAMPSPVSSRLSFSSLTAKLWDRLEIEEDPEPFWYLINCVAGLEIDLLRQCREVCRDMPDAIKFVVPTEKKTRSHGAKRMVTETKVKYQGYVFAKLRLCAEVYEAIQGLDLCRSWMGTVNHKGHRKLPPAPIALNELEVENFGLEEYEFEEDEEGESGDVIVDVADEDVEDKIDKEAIKAYLGLKVEDMVKVTAKGKFFNEDGIIRRLKDGKLFVRFYTYGTMFEEWLNPGDVRKLSNIEILKGLAGPSRPVTQRDFDGPSEGSGEKRPGDLRQSLTSEYSGEGGQQRNRRQDRNERRVRSDGFRNDEEKGRNDQNWNWYQDQKQNSRRRNDYADGTYSYQAGSNPRRDRGGDWAIGNVDSQWGRESSPNRRERQPRRDNRRHNEQADAAIRGDGDWSAFVTQPGGKGAAESKRREDDDDFFASLMSDLSSDLGKGKVTPTSSKNAATDSANDDFFSSLMSEISDDSASNRQRGGPGKRPNAPPLKSNQDDDFFAALEAELGSNLEGNNGFASKLDGTDDLFSKLEAELSPKTAPVSRRSKAPKTARNDADDFFAELEAEVVSSSDSAGSFFAELGAELATEVDEGSRPSVGWPITSDLDDFFATVGDQLTTEEMGGDSVRSEKVLPTRKAKRNDGERQIPSKMNPEDLTKQTVPALKDMLRERGLKVSGNKADLIDRLLQES